MLDFLDMTRILHLYQLSGAIPIWCWSVAPSGSRLLLSAPNEDGYCCLDRFESNATPLCIDGRYGDKYFTPNPETVRLSVNVVDRETIANTHENMGRGDNRLQNLEIVSVKRQPPRNPRRPWHYTSIVIFGWMLLVVLLAAGVILERWLAVAYLTIVSMTGAVVALLYGGQPRKLAAHLGSEYTHLVIVTKHTNEKNWQVYMGESSVVNALLNMPLENSSKDPQHLTSLQTLLQGLICAQWATAIGSAATKNWDAYAISFWVLFCIISHKFFFSSERIGKIWLSEGAGIGIRRYQTQLSSRRAFLNTIMGLNPDTFAKDEHHRILEDFDKQALKWIDPILKKSRDRDGWQEAARLALIERIGAARASYDEHGNLTQAMSTWQDTYGHNYWCKYISEGIEMAIKIGEIADIRTSISTNSKLGGLTSTEKSDDAKDTDDQTPNSTP
ncbi:hypothetical protein SCAR479_13877 [Seiridium cardinale]|uniref:Uncharacterized protein n=1 Tax=Seiridium cardinale TaxID=138064 RepID=A0ABR2X6Q5_9PEZI